jgi:hypothetical protein
LKKLDSLGLMTAFCQYNFDENEYQDSPKIDYKKIGIIIENDLSATKILVVNAIDDFN